jgi:hypothetical protein
MKEEGPGPAGHVLSITPPTPIETRRRLIGPPLVNARNQLQNDHPLPLSSLLLIFLYSQKNIRGVDRERNAELWIDQQLTQSSTFFSLFPFGSWAIIIII